MIVEQRLWSREGDWSVARPRSSSGAFAPQVVLCFGSEAGLAEAASTVPTDYPTATLLGCSTAGEISGTSVMDESLVATAIQFEHSRIATACRTISAASESRSVGELLARDLEPAGLVHAFVLAEGLNVNGTELVKGLRSALPEHVAVTGGLAADGSRFGHTSVWLGDRAQNSGVAILGLYSDRLRVGYGSMGGWDQFGPERVVTRSEGNVLYELDGESALSLYRTYLGSNAADLPASGLMFPLSIRSSDGSPAVVRTILGIDESAGSLVFAGDIPQGARTQLMKANVDRLIDGAHDAATYASYRAIAAQPPSLAILISCVGRRLVLKQRVEEEVESVRDVLGSDVVQCGFYSYGEIAPFAPSVKCELHNQTMTITTLSEN